MPIPELPPRPEEEKTDALSDLKSYKGEIDHLNAAFAARGIGATISACTCPQIPDILKTSEQLSSNVSRAVCKVIESHMAEAGLGDVGSVGIYSEELLKAQCQVIKTAVDEALQDLTITSANGLLTKLQTSADPLTYIQHGPIGRVATSVQPYFLNWYSPRAGESRKKLMADRFEKALSGTAYEGYSALSQHAYPAYYIAVDPESKQSTVRLECALEAKIDCPDALRNNSFFFEHSKASDVAHSGLDKSSILAAIHGQLNSVEGVRSEQFDSGCPVHGPDDILAAEHVPTFKVELTLTEEYRPVLKPRSDAEGEEYGSDLWSTLVVRSRTGETQLRSRSA